MKTRSVPYLNALSQYFSEGTEEIQKLSHCSQRSGLPEYEEIHKSRKAGTQYPTSGSGSFPGCMTPHFRKRRTMESSATQPMILRSVLDAAL
jgi:hypothetical protein